MAKNAHAKQGATVSGFINLYKPGGITSMEAVRRIKRLSRPHQKIGHGGTMDPMARGVLPICFGQATRLMEHVVGGRKRYRMEILLGVTTDTYDAEGEVVETGDAAGFFTGEFRGGGFGFPSKKIGKKSIPSWKNQNLKKRSCLISKRLLTNSP